MVFEIKIFLKNLVIRNRVVEKMYKSAILTDMMYFQVIGIGAGQQSRIHCTRIAGDKANNW